MQAETIIGLLFINYRLRRGKLDNVSKFAEDV
jgi:hypothetical protein